MDELTLLREAWDETPEPSPRAEAVARAMLLERTRRAAPRPAPAPALVRRGWAWSSWRVRLALAGVVAAAVAVGGGVVVQLREDSTNFAFPVAASAPAVDLLGQAATAALAAGTPTAGPGTWRYLRFEGFADHTSGTTTGQPRRASQFWYRMDGKKAATLEDGRVVVRNLPTGGLIMNSAALAKLPTDPEALLNRVAGSLKLDARDTWEWRAQMLYTSLNAILRENVLPAKVEAAVYLAIARIPGVDVVPEAVNADGRPVRALARVQDGWLRDEILLDRSTSRFVGERSIAVRDHRGTSLDNDSLVTQGTVLNAVVRTDARIVAEPGGTQ